MMHLEGRNVEKVIKNWSERYVYRNFFQYLPVEDDPSGNL